MKAPTRCGLNSTVTSIDCSGWSGESPGGLTVNAVESPPTGSSMRTEVSAWPSMVLLSENVCDRTSFTTTLPKSKVSPDSVARPRTA